MGDKVDNLLHTLPVNSEIGHVCRLTRRCDNRLLHKAKATLVKELLKNLY